MAAFPRSKNSWNYSGLKDIANGGIQWPLIHSVHPRGKEDLKPCP